MIDCTLDSGVGVDSCPYSLWKHAPKQSKGALYDVYLHLSGHFVTDFDNDSSDLLEFLLSRIVFIQKGKYRCSGLLYSETCENTSAYALEH